MKSKTSIDNGDGCAAGCFIVFLVVMLGLIIVYYGAIFWLIKYAIDSFS